MAGVGPTAEGAVRARAKAPVSGDNCLRGGRAPGPRHDRSTPVQVAGPPLTAPHSAQHMSRSDARTPTAVAGSPWTTSSSPPQPTLGSRPWAGLRWRRRARDEAKLSLVEGFLSESRWLAAGPCHARSSIAATMLDPVQRQERPRQTTRWARGRDDRPPAGRLEKVAYRGGTGRLPWLSQPAPPGPPRRARTPADAFVLVARVRSPGTRLMLRLAESAGVHAGHRCRPGDRLEQPQRHPGKQGRVAVPVATATTAELAWVTTDAAYDWWRRRPDASASTPPRLTEGGGRGRDRRSTD